MTMGGAAVRVLSFHAGYRCRNSGVCCSSNWPIPVEADRLARVQAAVASGRLRTDPAVRGGLFHTPTGAPSQTPVILATLEGRCVFHDPSGACHIQTALGHDALPLACRQFPRVCVSDPRGVSVTLSHYCPTAAGLLELEAQESEPILLNTTGFPDSGEYVGLDARSALPPLLRPGMLLDWASWWEIERQSVQTLLKRGRDAAAALSIVRGAAAALMHWSPGRRVLLDEVRTAFENSRPLPRTVAGDLIKRVLASVPDEFQERARWTTTSVESDAVTRRFLAAHAFANWSIHTAQGLSGWLESLETAFAFLEAGAGVRHTDLILRHLS